MPVVLHRLTVSMIAVLMLALLQFSLPARAGLFDNANPFSTQDGPLQVEQAFVFDSEQNGGSVKLIWTIPDDYYLYRDKIKLSYGPEIKELSRDYSQATQKQDPLFGQVWVFYNQAVVNVELTSTTGQPVDSVVTINYQGCWDGGICYPPVSKTINLSQVPLQTQPTSATDT
ncbi:MAG: protein-disulfide reductase DsbD, partial [Amphritea sp.]|nr:protein-disulfide reductase DsbD [Amphritea sp.]